MCLPTDRTGHVHWQILQFGFAIVHTSNFARVKAPPRTLCMNGHLWPWTPRISLSNCCHNHRLCQLTSLFVNSQILLGELTNYGLPIDYQVRQLLKPSLAIKISASSILDPGSGIQDPGSWILLLWELCKEVRSSHLSPCAGIFFYSGGVLFIVVHAAVLCCCLCRGLEWHLVRQWCLLPMCKWCHVRTNLNLWMCAFRPFRIWPHFNKFSLDRVPVKISALDNGYLHRPLDTLGGEGGFRASSDVQG